MPRATVSKVAALSMFAAGSFLCTSVAWTSEASAQEIRRYGEQEDNSGGGSGGSTQQRQYYPGQPVPQSQNQGGQAQGNQQSQSSQGEGEGEGQEQAESYEIRMFDPGGGNQKKGDSSQKRPTGKPEALYQGIIPGTRDIVEHLKDAVRENNQKQGPNLLTWIGFQADDSRSRVFIQTARQPSYQVERRKDGRRVVVSLQDTEITTENFRREIDASYFDRNVRYVEARSVDDTTVEVRIDLRAGESPEVSTDKGYLYLDFDASIASDDGQTS
jgi:hypothetical protein